ncbi:aspartate dehydrogenase [Arenibaculum pallidiluteum]|uniref:aspartate dehydrogenase n=1 Tax=Arenibaculum pallidiluteum TaxID=2812559 RepID=UPI001A95ACD9|nr:aspartate dehydrogenase [Arenibaculum pallidiluteum]
MRAIGLIGYGSIGRTVHGLMREAGLGGAVAGVLVRPGRARALLDEGVPAVESLDALLARGPALVAETAGQGAVGAYGAAVLEGGADLLVVSIGALADPALHGLLAEAAGRAGRQVLLTPGAVGGIDAIAAMRVSGLERVTYRSRKPPGAWKGTPAERAVDLDGLSAPAVFYRGSAREAALSYPRNANVAATVALAGLGFEATQVELVADPLAPGNVHEIEAEGASGRISVRLEGRPAPDNPKTSMLTALAVVRSLTNRDAAIAI